MATGYKIISAELKSIGKPQKSYKMGKIFHLITFKNLDTSDDNEYVLCVIKGNVAAARFTKIPIGAKLSGIVVFEERGKWYVSAGSNFSPIKARPLF